jgi:hypothetical protein
MAALSSSDHPDNGNVQLDYPPIEQRGGVSEFKLLALGTRGAGKTVFLSALFNQLKASNDSFYVVTTDPASRAKLLNTYNMVKGIEAGWPEGSKDPLRYEFAVHYPGPSGNVHIFDFNYVDFPGRFVVGDTGNKEFVAGDAKGQFDVQVEVDKTHSLIVLIDGVVVLQRIRQANEEGRTVEDEIDDMVDLIDRCAHRPVQFVITKSDVLAGIPLDKIRDVLMETRKFRNLIKQRQKLNIPTRLIKVSAVGDNFADRDPLSGVMIKRRGGRAEPYNLDVVMSFALTDTLLAALKPTVESKTRAQDAWRVISRISPVAGATRAISWFGKWAMVATGIPGSSFLEALEKAAERAKLGSEERQRSMKEILDKIRDVSDTIDAIINAQNITNADYIKNNPACNLLGGVEA